ncbi:MAG: YggS family pyridoxal phosphate-dependent enzyme [bacterium]
MENSLIYRNIESVKKRIKESAERVNRSSKEVKLVSVTKTQSVEKIEEIFRAGSLIIGENRVQEARDKRLTMKPDITNQLEWRLIGKLQKNKVKMVLELFDLVESVDSFSLAEEIARIVEKTSRKPFDIYIQVNTGEESQKNGVFLEDALNLIKSVYSLPLISVKGLMCIPPFSKNPENSRIYFRKLFSLRNQVQEMGFDSITDLSMGMSNDFEVAIEEGATHVRVGSAIFGERI